MSDAEAPALRKEPIYALFVVLVWGLVIGAMMTWHHDQQLYGNAQAELVGCVESAQVNCDAVNTSEWSELAGIPIATLSMAAYGAVGVLAGLVLAGKRGAHPLLVLAGVIGSLSALFLAYDSKVEVGYWCLYCLQHYAVNFSILGLSLAAGKPRAADLDPASAGIGAGALVALIAVFAGGEHVYRGSLLGGTKIDLDRATVGILNGDPKGPAPEREFTVATEENGPDGQPEMVTFKLDPDDAWKGNPTAKVAVVEFADLECGYCKRSSAELSRLYAAYGDRVLFVFKNYPMNPDCNPGVQNKRHPSACNAAIAAACAQKQGQFWRFSDLAFKNQHQLGKTYLRTYAQTVGVDVDQFDQCVRDPAMLAQVRHDAEVGQSLHIHGTPRIYINGKLYRSGTSAEAMARAIELALGTSAADATKAAQALHEEDLIMEVPADIPAAQKVDVAGLSFKIDTFEDAIADGKAVSAKHQIPAIRASWYDAKAACEAAGKRMCTEEEWVSACQNTRAVDENNNGQFADDMIEGTAYPYADYHDNARCWDGKSDGAAPDGTAWRPVYTGEMPGCVTPTGVYDLTGNVEEWVGETPDKAVLLGGAFDTSEDHARCYRRNDTFGAGYGNARTGFRCCSNP